MKIILVRLIKFHIRILQKLIIYITNKTESSINRGYEDLAPINNLERDEYINALEWAVENEKVRNVGLTGTHGSGKSSILRTFEKLHPENNYLRISLATFREKETNDDDINRLIERSILQQIFYIEDSKEIPESRFMRITAINKIRVLWQSLILLIWSISIIEFLNPSAFNNIEFWKNSLIKNSESYIYILLTINFSGLVFLIFKIIYLFKNLSFSKLNIIKGEIELEKTNDASILNKYLDEILYFFEVTKYNVIFIEDIDRYENKDIFTKLRELNNLLNESKLINRKILFVYALKDDLFKDKSRTKFFDFIIPIIPVINTTNSKEKLLEKFKANNLETVVSKQFISNISLYIDDMRILKNIFNEFMIYNGKLCDLNLNQEKLFSIIVYKNLNPIDFSALQQNKGIVFNAFQNKYKLIKKLKKEIETKKSNYEGKIEVLEFDYLNSISELRELYISRFLRNISFKANSIIVEGINIEIDELFEDSNFIKFRSAQEILYKGPNGQRPSKITFKELEDSLSSDLSYEEREQLIIDKTKNQQEEYKKIINSYRFEILELDSKRLSELYELEIEEELSEIEVIDDTLIMYILRNGYIDEDFPIYISYFYEGSLTKNDMEFLLSIKNRNKLPHNFELSNFKELLNSLEIKEFKQVEILNYDLTNFLLENPTDYEIQLNKLIQQTSNEQKESIDFIEGFINNNENNIRLFFNALSKVWSNIWKFVKNSNFSENRKIIYHDLIIRYSELEDIIIINRNTDDSIFNYLSRMDDFVEKYENDEDLEHIKEVLKELNVSFYNLIIKDKESHLFDFIYEYNLYKINETMISLIIRFKSENPKDLSRMIHTSNYSAIKKSGCLNLIEYIEENIKYYVDNVLLLNESDINEDEDFFLELLNNESMTMQQLEGLINKQHTPISDITNVNDTKLWQNIFNEIKIHARWENIISYFSEFKEIDDLLSFFLNEEENFKSLAKKNLNEFDIPDELSREISKAIVLNQKLSFNSFSYLIKSIPYSYNSLSFQDLSEEKIKFIVETKFLNVTVNNYDMLREKFSPLHIRLLENDFKSFLKSIDEFNLDEQDIGIILECSEISRSDKFETLKSIEITELEIDEDLANKILDILAHFNPYEIGFDLSHTLINNGSNTEKKVMFLISQTEYLDEDQITDLLSILPYPIKKIANKGERPRIIKNKVNLQLAEFLLSIGYISSYKIKNKKIQINTKRY